MGGQLVTDFTIAIRNLVQHRKRTLLLGGAIGGVTALLVLLTGLAAGIRETMLRSATTLMTGHLNVGGFYKVTAGQASPVVTDAAKVLAVAKAALPELDYAVQRGRGWAKLVSDTHTMQVVISGVDIAEESAFRQVLRLSSGALDDLGKPGTLLLFDSQAKKLEVKVGDTLTFSAPTSRGTSNTVDVRVVAIARDMGLLSTWNVFIPNATLRDLYQLNAGSTGGLQLYLRDLAKLPQAIEALRKALEAAGYRMMDPEPAAFWMKFEKVNREDWTGQKLDVTSWEDEVSFMTWTLQALQGLTALLIGVLLAIVVVGIMNTMWIAIRERTREIGTLRAIGMQRGRVLWMFLCEALVLGIAGTAAGGATGAVLAALVNALAINVPLAMQLFLMNDTLTLSVHAGSVLSSIITISLVTGVAALYPALRAAKLAPVTAMTHFG